METFPRWKQFLTQPQKGLIGYSEAKSTANLVVGYDNLISQIKQEGALAREHSEALLTSTEQLPQDIINAFPNRLRLIPFTLLTGIGLGVALGGVLAFSQAATVVDTSLSLIDMAINAGNLDPAGMALNEVELLMETASNCMKLTGIGTAMLGIATAYEFVIHKRFSNALEKVNNGLSIVHDSVQHALPQGSKFHGDLFTLHRQN